MDFHLESGGNDEPGMWDERFESDKGQKTHRADVSGSKAVTRQVESSFLEHSPCSDPHASSGFTLLPWAVVC